MNTHDEMQRALGPILNAAVGVVVVAGMALVIGCITIELIKRPRFSVRTLLIAVTILSIILGMAVIPRR